MIDSALGEAADRDMRNLIPIMYFVLFGLIAVFFRSFSITFGAIATIGAALITSMGVAGWMGIELSPTSACAPTIILTLAVADSIHILATIFQLMSAGKGKIEAITGSLKINFQAVILTSVTTAIGFLTMNFSDAPPFRDLGNIVAVGVVAAMIYSLLFLPSLVAVLPMKKKKDLAYANGVLMDHLAEFVITHRKPIFYSMITLMLITVMGITRIDLDDDFVKFYDHSFEFRRDTDFIEENLGGFYRIEYSLESDGPGGIHDPDYLNVLDAFANWYRSQPSVTHVNVLTDTIKRLNKNLHEDNQAFYNIPKSREQIAQYLLLYEMSLPFGLDTNDMINVDKSSSRMSVSLKDVTSSEILEIDKRAYRWLSENAPEAMVTGGAGMAIMFSHISRRNIESMLIVTIGALFLVSLLMMAAMRVFKLGIVFIVPNLMPAVMAFGVWGFFVERVGMVISVMASFTLGIIVDDSIHFISKYLRARRELGFTSVEAVRYAFNTVGVALWLTTLVTASGFSVLMFSGFQMNTDMGSMTVITIIIALLLDFFLLPTLLIKLEGPGRVRKKYKIKYAGDHPDSSHVNVYTAESGRK
jgi:predicted RND superfamily exporter protein